MQPSKQSSKRVKNIRRRGEAAATGLDTETRSSGAVLSQHSGRHCPLVPLFRPLASQQKAPQFKSYLVSFLSGLTTWLQLPTGPAGLEASVGW